MKHLSAIILVLFASCKKDLPEVGYVVTCSNCDITYENKGGNTEQRTVTGSWDYDFEAESGQFVYISAQNNNDNGTVSVRINVDGKSFKDGSSSGAYVIATASGSVP